MLIMIIKRIPNFEWKKLERFAKVFRQLLNLHFTILEMFCEGELFSENNSNFQIEIGFRLGKSLGLSKLHSLCANEFLKELVFRKTIFQKYFWTYRETFSSRLSKLPL